MQHPEIHETDHGEDESAQEVVAFLQRHPMAEALVIVSSPEELQRWTIKMSNYPHFKSFKGLKDGHCRIVTASDETYWKSGAWQYICIMPGVRMSQGVFERLQTKLRATHASKGADIPLHMCYPPDVIEES